MKNFIAVSMVWLFTVGWWGAMCPEFCFTRDCIEIVAENSWEIREFDSEEDFIEFLNCDSSQIEVKSKLIELWKLCKGKRCSQ